MIPIATLTTMLTRVLTITILNSLVTRFERSSNSIAITTMTLVWTRPNGSAKISYLGTFLP